MRLSDREIELIARALRFYAEHLRRKVIDKELPVEEMDIYDDIEVLARRFSLWGADDWGFGKRYYARPRKGRRLRPI